MNKRDFFINAMKAGRLGEKDWLLGAFSVLRGRKDALGDMLPFDVLYQLKDEGYTEIIFIDGEGNLIQLDDYEYDYNDPKPPYRFKDTLTITKEEMPSIKGDQIKTTYGNLLANWLLCYYPFGEKVKYFEGKFKIKDVEKIIEQKLVSDPKEGEQVPDGAITIDEYKRFRRSSGLLDGLTQLAVPSASEKSMTGHPDGPKLRDELLEKHKDELHDPAVVAEIESQLVALDREWLDGDPSMGFYAKDEYISDIRKKAHYMIGMKKAFDGEGKVVDGSLSEGIDEEDLPELISDLRESSYDRGKSTQMGGEAVKFILRIMQNSTLTQDDCGSKLGIEVDVTDTNKEQFVGNWFFKGEELVQVTHDNVSQFVGKTKTMRSPLYCRTERDNFCKTCIGGRYADHEKGLPTAASSIASKFMNIFMKSMHSKALTIEEYDYKQSLL